jgi:DNA-binding CsgD family transcriptional regulator/sugar-specific transcriptional regulator TrmB
MRRWFGPRVRRTEIFESLGLSTAAEAVYRAMLSEPSWGVVELARHTQLPEPEVRAALDALIELALVRESTSDRGRLRPASPQVGLALLLARAKASVAQRQYEIETTQAAISALAAAHSAELPREDMVRLDTLDAVRARLEDLALMAREECVSFNPGGAHKPDAMAASKPLNQVALERGVAIRAVYQDSFRNDPQTLAYARWLADLGGETRTVPMILLQMIIIDRKLALLPLDPNDPRHGAVEVSSPGVLTALCALFDYVWSTATPFGRSAAIDDHGLDPSERELVRLLGDGHTDEAAARKLGLSVRTIQRMMADLTTRLGAESRFQAGANAVRQGWL